MAKLRLAVIMIALVPRGAVPQQAPNDWLIVPNVRVGPITASSTERSMRETFGAESVISTPGHGDVKTDSPVTLIYKDDLSRVIGLFWRGKGSQAHPDRILFCFGHHPPGPWRTASGIGCGTTLRELEAINGRSFTLLGYGRDHSGTVTSWQGGKLDRELGPKGAMEIALSPNDTDWLNGLTPAERRSVLEDKEIHSSDPVIQRLNPVVYEMVFKFPEIGDSILKSRRP